MPVSPAPAIPAATAAPAAVAHVRTRGILADRDVVRAGIRVVDRSQSHPVYRIEVGGIPFVYAKALAGGDAEQGSPDRERAAYALAERDPALAALVPGWHGPDDGWLVLDAVRGRSLLDLVVAGGPAAAAGCAALGRALGRWHQQAVGADAADAMPWVLRLATPERPSFLATNEGVRAFLADVGGRADLAGLLGPAAAAWEASTVIHGDLRLDNGIVREADGGVVLLDWETAGAGDPAWDVAAVVQELVALPGVADLGGAVHAAAPCLSAFFQAYGHEGPAPQGVGRLTAARLLQRAVQVSAWDPRGRTPETDRLVGLALAAVAEPGAWWAAD